jgi:ABC-type glycerol-3-phosphate transport system substrate-binding protein
MKINNFLSSKTYKSKTIWALVFVLGISLLAIIDAVTPTSIQTYFDTQSIIRNYQYSALPSVYGIPTYTEQQKIYQSFDYPFSGYTDTYTGSSLIGNKMTEQSSIYQSALTEYDALTEDNEGVFLLDQANDVRFNFDFPYRSLNYISVDYYVLEEGVEDTKISLLINDELPFYESQNIVLPVEWQFTQETFALDRYENELQPASSKVFKWRNIVLKDHRQLHPDPYAYLLSENDTISLQFVNAKVLIGNISFVELNPIPTYQDYLATLPASGVEDTLQLVSARSFLSRSDSSIRLRTEQDPSNMYYDTQFLRLNTIFGDSWEKGGQSITYPIEIAKAGFYHLSFKYRQYLLNEMTTHRNIYINGEIPFKEAEAFSFPHTMQFKNRSLVGENNQPLKVFFEQGTNYITLEATHAPYRQAIETIQFLMNQIQSLSLAIKRYTAGGSDLYRDWDIETFFPTAQEDLLMWAEMIDALYESLLPISSSTNPSQLANLKVGANRLKSLSRQINKLPSLMVQFSDGDSSVNQMLGSLLQQFFRSSLEIERLMIHGQRTLPRPSANFLVTSYEGGARLILSFINNPYSASAMNEEDLNVWVNHPRQYIEIMQALIDQFYPGDRRVTLSQMPDENKLILSNISGQSPDVAIGVNHWIPYEFAARDAALDLRTFNSFTEVVQDFSPGAFIPYVFEEGVYGLPGTQNFWVTYYRKDIMNSLGIEQVPQTWDEVIGILPLLQSYGLNYFVPLSQYSGLKPFVATLPFIYQFGGQLYGDDGMSTAINDEKTLEGITLMAELFTLYNIPKFVASFYNNFRYGTLPIGIGDLGTYLLLSSAATELDGLWGMDLHPGVYNEQTQTIDRDAASGAQGSMILADTNHREESWDFLSWWMSEEIQVMFGEILQTTYGKTYFWNSANVNAFARSGMPQEYKNVVLAQWEYATEASRIPGTYMVEREISNAWTNIVFNGINPRQAIDEAVRISNREIIYKMAEFGYTDKGVILKPYIVPTKETIQRWLVAHA